MRERGGRTKAQAVPRVDQATLEFAIIDGVEAGSTIHTDENRSYRGLHYLGYQHETINRTFREYVRDGVTTNSIEAVWAVLKRGI
jgi:transposase-like protein